MAKISTFSGTVNRKVPSTWHEGLQLIVVNRFDALPGTSAVGFSDEIVEAGFFRIMKFIFQASLEAVESVFDYKIARAMLALSN